MMMNANKMEWFRDAKYGMFIHWGLYSQLARGEWTYLLHKMDMKEYEKLSEVLGYVYVIIYLIKNRLNSISQKNICIYTALIIVDIWRRMIDICFLLILPGRLKEAFPSS